MVNSAPKNSFFFGGVIVLLVLAHWLDNCHALAGRDDICQRLKSGSHYKGKHEASETTEVTSGKIISPKEGRHLSEKGAS